MSLDGKLDFEPENKGIGRFTDLYFRPKRFENNGEIYARLGIKIVKKSVVAWGRYRNYGKGKYPNGYILWDKTPLGLRNYEWYTRFNESLHLPFLAFFSYDAVTRLSSGSLMEQNLNFLALDAISILANSYLVMLQRYNRARIYQTIRKIEEKNL